MEDSQISLCKPPRFKRDEFRPARILVGTAIPGLDEGNS
jgi:hypothetical protein